MELRDKLQSALGTAYTLEQELPGGGMSRVFVAEDTALARKVVVKLLAPERAASVSAERFKREIRLAARLQHPHIVPLHAAGDADGLPYYTMPFISGESLRQRLMRARPLPIPEAIRILRDVADALVFAHKQGIVHRDIKPENVLLSGEHALVADFGVAKALSESILSDGPILTEVGVSLGTPAYMSPEQAAGEQTVDHRADLYAFGVVAYEMLAGHAPFAGRSMQQVIAAHITEVPTSVDQKRQDIPPPLSALVMQCLAKRPVDRPQSAHNVLKTLEAIAAPRAPAADTPRVAFGRRTLAIGAIAAFAAAVIGAVFASRRGAEAGLNPRRVVVAPFINLTGDSTLNVLGPLIADGVTRGLEQLDSVEVVSSQAALRDTSGGVRKLADLGALPSLGEEMRAGRVIGGSYSRQGDTLRLQARIVDARDGRLERALDPVTGLVSAPSAAIERVRESIATALQASQAKATIGSIGHLPTLAAYRAFLTAWELDKESPKAVPYLITATRLDTTFTLAQYWLAVNYAGQERWEAADSVLKVLSARTAGFSPVERELFTEVTAFVHHDWERDLSASRQLLKRDSTYSNAGGVAFVALQANRPREVLATLQPIPLARVPEQNWGHWNKMALANHMLGDYKAELTAATTGRARGVGAQILLLEKQLRALAAGGKLSEMRQKIDSLIGAWRSSIATAGTGGVLRVSVSTMPPQVYERLALELHAHGQRPEAESYVRKGLDWHTNNANWANNSDTRATDSVQVSLARLLMLDKQLDSARVIWMKLAPQDTLYAGARIQLAIISALKRDTAAAQWTLDTLDARANLKYAFGQPRLGEARIAAALGRKDDAVRFLRLAMNEGSGFGTTWHSDADFRPLQDYEQFKALLRPIDLLKKP